MNATRPEAETEYSRAEPGQEGDFERPQGRLGGTPRTSGGVLWIVFLAGLLGAAVLVAAEFTTLFKVQSNAYGAPVRTEATGAHHSYALIPIALLAGALTLTAVRSRSRAALVAIGALGLVSLAIALIGDLPDAQVTGIVRDSRGLATASSTPSTGLYLETAGSVVLLIAAAAGLLLQPKNRDLKRRTPFRSAS